MTKRTTVMLGCGRCGQIASPTASRRGTCTSCGGELVRLKEAPEELVRDYLYRPISLRAYRQTNWVERTTGR